MIRNIENVIKIILIMAIVFMILTPISNASTMDNIFSEGDKFLQEGKGEGSNLIAQSQLKTNINDLYNILFTMGVALSVLIGAVLGIKFMVGSVEEQAKVKETLIPYVIGCIVVFGAFGIWKIVITIGGNIFN